MPRDRRDVEAGLVRKGFRMEEGDHHFFIYHTTEGKKSSVYTKTSHGKKELSDSLLSMMARQCKLNKKQFLELVDCPLARDEYEQQLEADGHL